ncbi:MFS transporter [Sulfurospirillum sp. 1612]|uniref:MFS transporter n=1 Tax=Sulfurospirillum sp. 1612 TaxID=3094835 RepID=UPI002F91EFC1
MTKNTRSVLQISSLFVAIGFLALGYGMIFTYIGIYLKGEHISNAVIGMINAAFFMGSIASSIFSQKIISQVGHIRSFSAFASVMVVTFLLQTLFSNEILWGVLRFFAGFAYYGLLIIIESWLNEKSTSDDRGMVLATYTVVFYLFTAIGQFFLSFDITLSETVFIAGSVLVLFSVVAIALTKIKEPVLEPLVHYSFPKIYSIVPLALSACFLAGIFVGGLFTMVPVYILTLFHSVEVVSYFMIMTLFGGLLSQWPIGMLSDKFGRRKLIAGCGFFTAIISILFLFATHHILVIYILGFLFGFAMFSIYPLGVARANDVVDENKNIVEISRALLFVYGVGSFMAPAFMGFLMEYFHGAIFVIFSLLGIFLTFYALSKKRVADDDMSVFVSMPVTSGAELSQLDPRVP